MKQLLASSNPLFLPPSRVPLALLELLVKTDSTASQVPLVPLVLVVALVTPALLYVATFPSALWSSSPESTCTLIIPTFSL